MGQDGTRIAAVLLAWYLSAIKSTACARAVAAAAQRWRQLLRGLLGMIAGRHDTSLVHLANDPARFRAGARTEHVDRRLQSMARVQQDNDDSTRPL